MYPIRIGADEIDLDRLTDDEVSRRLQQARDAASAITCLCHEWRRQRPPAEPLRLTPVRLGTVYHLRREQEGELHHPRCQHRTMSAAGLAELGYAEGAVSSDESGLRVSLDFGLAIANADRDNLPSTGTHQAGPRALRTRSRASLLGLLHLLWTQAELNVHDPLRPPLPNPWERLRSAARRVQPARMRSLSEHGLSSLLLLPAHALPGGDQARRNFAKLRDAAGKRRILAVAAVGADELGKRNAGGFVDLREIFGVAASAHASAIEAALHRSPAARAALASGHKVVLFGVGPARDLGRGLACTLEHVVLMAVTPWLTPCESMHEIDFAMQLEDARRYFVKPLRHDAEEPVHPDFVLIDTATAVPIEVYGMRTPDYVARKQAKQAYYADNYPGRHIEWTATEEPLAQAMARLPVPQAQGRP